MGRGLSPGEHATVDQWLTALHDGERRWPHSERVQADGRMEQLLLDGLHGPTDWPWQTLRPGSVWLLWPAALTAVVCEPGQDIAGVAAETFPRYAATTPCQRCEGTDSPIYGGVVMNAGAVLVGVLVCLDCALDLEANFGPVTWTGPAREEVA